MSQLENEFYDLAEQFVIEYAPEECPIKTGNETPSIEMNGEYKSGDKAGSLTVDARCPGAGYPACDVCPLKKGVTAKWIILADKNPYTQ